MEKTFIIFGCGNSEVLREMANNSVVNTYLNRMAIAREFNPKTDHKPDALLYLSKSLFSVGGYDTYYVTTLGGRGVCSFKFNGAMG